MVKNFGIIKHYTATDETRIIRKQKADPSLFRGKNKKDPSASYTAR